PLSVRTWDCPSCGTKAIDRDVNAAITIRQQGILKLKAEGLSVSAHRGLCETGHAPAAA
ncbi:zinc ribbon domain-containing protein, partial [Halomonas sp. GFAJ-1]|uniref:zinc ribbon domain-containing protein n=1 Tax=Halomonas sp. GFAJ-1 TaxID=1118153 RepID=UPI00023A1AF4